MQIKKWKQRLVGAILATVLLINIAANFHTYGIHLGSAGGSLLLLEVNQKADAEIAMGGSSTCIYSNAFGRTVVAYSLIPANPDSFWGKMHAKYGNVVSQIYTIPTALTLTTHLDFFNMYHKDGYFLTPLIVRAGKPSEQLTSNDTLFCYRTLDGYKYHVQATVGGGAYLRAIYDPQGNLLNDKQIQKLTLMVLVCNIAVVSVLSILLVVLIKVPNAIRKRKALPQPD